jgi:uncharacterized protein (UPF0297 family)
MILNNDRIVIKTMSRPANDSVEEQTDPRELFHTICQAIREGGYNPALQIVGYIVSEDPTHITNYKSARTLMSKLDRDELLEEMVKTYIESVEKEFKEKNN